MGMLHPSSWLQDADGGCSHSRVCVTIAQSLTSRYHRRVEQDTEDSSNLGLVSHCSRTTLCIIEELSVALGWPKPDP